MTREYVSVTCPHCAQTFASIPLSIIETQKSTDCKRHLRVCYKYDGIEKDEPKAKKQKVGNEEVLRELKRMRDEMRQMKEEQRNFLQTIAASLGPPAPQKLDEVPKRIHQRLAKAERDEKRAFDAGRQQNAQYPSAIRYLATRAPNRKSFTKWFISATSSDKHQTDTKAAQYAKLLHDVILEAQKHEAC